MGSEAYANTELTKLTKLTEMLSSRFSVFLVSFGGIVPCRVAAGGDTQE